MATLKISDLSVGDWVRCNGFKATIAGYNAESGSIQVLTKQKNKMWFGLDDIDPIPITAEILEKNGWVLDKASRWHTYTINDIRVNVWVGRNNEGRIEVSRKDPLDGEWHFNYADIEVVKITVHQLQHALRLAGVDKEINL